jgi:GTPase SAR1 family protein
MGARKKKKAAAAGPGPQGVGKPSLMESLKKIKVERTEVPKKSMATRKAEMNASRAESKSLRKKKMAERSTGVKPQ